MSLPLCSALRASAPHRPPTPTITDVKIVFFLKVYNCCVLTAAIVAESQLCLIDCDCDWQKLGSIVWPLVLSRLRSPAKPAARKKARGGYWLLSIWRRASFRLQTANSTGAIVWFNCSKKEREKGGEINKLSTESVIYRRSDIKKKKDFFFLVLPPLLLPPLPLCCIL